MLWSKARRLCPACCCQSDPRLWPLCCNLCLIVCARSLSSTGEVAVLVIDGTRLVQEVGGTGCCSTCHSVLVPLYCCQSGFIRYLKMLYFTQVVVLLCIV